MLQVFECRIHSSFNIILKTSGCSVQFVLHTMSVFLFIPFKNRFSTLHFNQVLFGRSNVQGNHFLHTTVRCKQQRNRLNYTATWPPPIRTE